MKKGLLFGQLIPFKIAENQIFYWRKVVVTKVKWVNRGEGEK